MRYPERRQESLQRADPPPPVSGWNGGAPTSVTAVFLRWEGTDLKPNNCICYQHSLSYLLLR